MPALLTLCPKDAPSSTVVLREGESPVAGRDPGCEVLLEDVRASTRHARFDWKERVWRLVDQAVDVYVQGLPEGERKLLSGVRLRRAWLANGKKSRR